MCRDVAPSYRLGSKKHGVTLPCLPSVCNLNETFLEVEKTIEVRNENCKAKGGLWDLGGVPTIFPFTGVFTIPLLIALRSCDRRGGGGGERREEGYQVPSFAGLKTKVP